MVENEQLATVAFLSRPDTHGVETVDRVDTHISHIFLAGDKAYKLKRALDLGFLDYSTRGLRRRNCEAEVAVNRRTAPEMYLGVVPVTKTADGLALGGDGETVDWLVVMKRFDRDCLFDRLAAGGDLDGRLIEHLADTIARFHRHAPRKPRHGGASAMHLAYTAIESQLKRAPDRLFAGREVDTLSDAIRGSIDKHADLLDARRGQGFVRQCHGDLHLANVCLLDGRPTLFDAVEFSDDIACVDVLYDLAFVLMDLLRFGLAGLANRLFNRYLANTRDYAGLAPLPLFMAMRAAIRAMAAGLSGNTEKTSEAREYFDLAFKLPGRPDPRLVAIGGLSGSGKTTVARRLAIEIAPGVGAVHLQSDAIRKRLFGVTPETRLPEDAYGSEISARVFETMHDDARRALQAGQSVILDATHMSPSLRRDAEDLAGRENVPFTGYWLDAPVATLETRAQARSGDASDADAAIVRQQSQVDLGDITWQKVDAGDLGRVRPIGLVRQSRPSL